MPTTHKLLNTIVLILALSLVIFAGRVTLSTWYEYRSQEYSDAWQEAGRVDSIEEWFSAKEAIGTALCLQPTRPELLQQASLIQEWRAFSTINQDADIIEKESGAFEQAAQAFRRYTEYVPVDPGAWSHLARFKLASGEFDDEFRKAFSNAIHFGPHVVDAQFELGVIIGAAWPLIIKDDELFPLAISSLKNTLRGAVGRRVLQNLKSFEVLDQVCEVLDLTSLSDYVAGECTRINP